VRGTVPALCGARGEDHVGYVGYFTERQGAADGRVSAEGVDEAVALGAGCVWGIGVVCEGCEV
jgi:hypothetical protein